MTTSNRLIDYVSDYALSLVPDLVEELGCENQSELLEKLILTQRHSSAEVESRLAQRSRRGRRWPKKKGRKNTDGRGGV